MYIGSRVVELIRKRDIRGSKDIGSRIVDIAKKKDTESSNKKGH